MRNLSTSVRLAATVWLMATMTGCATILGGGSAQTVDLRVEPTSASYVVRSSTGLEMASGTGSQTLRLPRKNEYQIDVKAPGYQTRTVAISKGTNGWVWGNLVVGWLVGFGVDFLTGSAFKLEPSMVQISLGKATADGSLPASVRFMDDAGRLMREVVLSLPPEAPTR